MPRCLVVVATSVPAGKQAAAQLIGSRTGSGSPSGGRASPSGGASNRGRPSGPAASWSPPPSSVSGAKTVGRVPPWYPPSR